MTSTPDGMAGSAAGTPAGGPAADEESTGPVIRDKRRIDPATGGLRTPSTEAAASRASGTGDLPGVPDEKEASMGDQDMHDAMAEGDDAFGGAVGDAVPGGAADPASGAELGKDPADHPVHGDPAQSPNLSAEHPDTRLAAERLADLQRLQAEYINYKRRVDRDRDRQKDVVIAGVIGSMLPVLDDIHFARQHGELESGPFAKIAEKLEGVLSRYGVDRYGQPGETFDPNVHDAAMHLDAELAPGTTETTVVQVMQPGYRVNERVIRPALVAVADPK